MKLEIKHPGRFLRLIGFLSIVLIFVTFSCKSPDGIRDREPITSLEEYRKLRSDKLNRSRLIHNSDGNEHFYPIKLGEYLPGTEYLVQPPRDTIETDYELTIDNFLNLRTSGLLGSDVTTISYCTVSSGFGLFTHNTKAGELLTRSVRQGTIAAAPELIKLGTDPLEITCDFAHENGFEIFWSKRMNDTHDAAHRPENPNPLFPRLKQENPHLLMGTVEERVPSRWSSVDFKHQKIRDLCVEFFTEVCENYDVDGIELDFFRHLFLFGNVARHEGVATAQQLDMMTDMVTKIREMTERVGMEKGKPILISVRVPDSFEYCEDVGIALKKWVERGLIDIVIGSGYFRANPWAHMVNAMRNYDAKFYAGFDEPRIREEHLYLKRLQNPVYRARASAAWQAGVEGIYIFNQYNTRSRFLYEVGEADKLTTTNNLYFVTYRRRAGLSDPNFYLNKGEQHVSLPFLTPENPVMIKAEPLEYPMEIGNESNPADVFVVLYTKGVKANDLEVSVNNTSATYRNRTGDGLMVFKVPRGAIMPGRNNLKVSAEEGRVSTERKLLDAAILFMRNPDDPELKELAELCY